MLRFVWDENKNKANFQKHDIWFEEAIPVFDDPLGRLFFDQKHSETEGRFVLIGMNTNGVLLIVVHLYQESDGIVRIISARKGTKKELKTYEERI